MLNQIFKYMEYYIDSIINRFSILFLFTPYFSYTSSLKKDKYKIIKNDYDISKKSIIYFAGLFQNAQLEYKDISNNLSSYNHIYINTYFNNNDIYKDTLIKIIDELGEIDIECVIGFSFGGSLSLQFKEIYLQKKNKIIKTILISPAGFQSNTFLEKTIKVIGKYLYSLYCNDKLYMINNYPLYQNTNILSNTDYIIVSTSDNIHNPNPIKTHENSIIIKHASHFSMLQIVKKQNIIFQLIKNSYKIENVSIKPLTSNMNKILFGSHFYPYHITLWLSVSSYNLYYFIKNGYSYINLFYGFLLASSLWSLAEYIAHRVILHNILYVHHKKHHIYPNKLSIIHSPMTPFVFSWITLYYIFKLFKNQQIVLSIFIFIQLNYLVFEYVHLLAHNYKGSNNIILNAKYYHKLHHIDENVNYSFITPFWDYLFGTLSSKYDISFIELLFGFIPFYSFFIHKKQVFI